MKKIIAGLAIVVLLVLVAVAGLIVFVDPNDLRPVIAEQVKESTGRDLVLAGDLAWSFYPRLGIAMGAAELGNPPGMEQHAPLFAMAGARLSLDVLPLFRKQLHINEVVLQDVAVNLLVLEDGRSNLDGLSGQDGSERNQDLGPGPDQDAELPKPEFGPKTQSGPGPKNQSGPESQARPGSETQPGSGLAGWDISIAGVRIVNAGMRIDDRQAGTMTEISPVNLSISHLVPDQWVGMSLDAAASMDQMRTRQSLQAQARLAADLATLELRDVRMEVEALGEKIPGGKKVFRMQANAVIDLESGALTVDPLQLEMDDLRLAGNLDVTLADKPLILAEFNADTLDFNPLLRELRAMDSGPQDAPGGDQGPARDGQPGQDQGDSQPQPVDEEDIQEGQLSREEPDLSGLSAVNARLTFKAGALLVDALELTDTSLEAGLQDGQLRLRELQTHAFGGKIQLSALLNAAKAPARYVLDVQAGGLRARDALTALAGTDILSGTAAMTAGLQGEGLSAHALRHAPRGEVALKFEDGALWGINIPLELRRIQALLKGRTLPEENAQRKTDFSSLSASFQIQDGRAETRDLAMASPLLRMDGHGVVMLPEERMDMRLDVGVVGTLEGQQGKEWEELRGLRIPLRVSGPLAQPSFALDADDVLTQRAEQEVEKLKEKGEEKLRDKLREELGDEAGEGVGGLLKKLF